MRILLLEDEPLVAKSIACFLEARGHEVVVLHTPKRLFHELSDFGPSILVLDKNLGAYNGLEIVRTLRESPYAATGVIMITGHDCLEEKLKGFAGGVDDYLIKPFEFLELEARILAVYRRSIVRDFDDGWLRISLAQRELSLGGKVVPLSHAQWLALSVLLERSPSKVSREEVGAVIWGANHTRNLRSIDRVIARLRSTIESNSKTPKYIHAVRGAGYCFDVRD